MLEEQFERYIDFNSCIEMSETDVQNMDASDLADTIDFLQHNLDSNPGIDSLARQDAHKVVGWAKRYLNAINLKREAELGDFIRGPQ